MKTEEINSSLREVFNNLVNDGAKKRHLCGFTLGAQNEPQFDNFLKGTDFGLKPLQRLIQNLGYNFNIIILPQVESEETIKFIEESNQEFLSFCKNYLIEKLEDENAIKSATIAKTGLLVDISNELFEEIIK
jgi:hypothetical protein